MPKIINAIPKQAFELIRDRIGFILKDELPSQATLNSDSNLDASVFCERIVPVNESELPIVNVSLLDGSYDSSNIRLRNGGYTYAVDVHFKAKTTNSQDGDTASNFRLQRLLGVCQAILLDHRYRTLNFPAGFISSVKVSEFKIATPPNKQDAESTTMGRIFLMVKACETVELIDADLIDGNDTRVKLCLTDKGYEYVLE